MLTYDTSPGFLPSYSAGDIGGHFESGGIGSPAYNADPNTGSNAGAGGAGGMGSDAAYDAGASMGVNQPPPPPVPPVASTDKSSWTRAVPGMMNDKQEAVAGAVRWAWQGYI